MLKEKIKGNKIRIAKKLYKEGFSSYKIAKMFNVSPVTIQKTLKRHDILLKPPHAYSIKLLSSSGKMTKEKAYLMGVIGPGDGFVRGNRTIGLRVVDKDFADYFGYCIEKTYSIKCHREIETTKHKPVFITLLHSIEACKDLLSNTKSIKEFKEGTWKIPKVIFDSDANIKCAYVKGFADSQGCVYMRPNRRNRYIFLSSKNLEGLKQFCKLLESIGIKSGIRKNAIYLCNYGSFKKFKELIGFTIGYKNQKLETMLQSYKNIHSRYLRPVEVRGL